MTQQPEQLAIEPEDLELEPEPALELEPEPVISAVPALVEVLPADFPLPTLIQFVPDPRLRTECNKAAAYALALDVKGLDGLQQADAAVAVVRSTMKAIEEAFAEPTDIAHQLHKRLTWLRGEWLSQADAAVKTVGHRMWAEKKRLDDEERERKRREQEEADRQERERIRKQAEAAEKAKAPAPVVENLKKQAETATAAPVYGLGGTSTKLANTSLVGTWKARIAGTPASDEPNPTMDALSDTQRAKVLDLLRAILDGKAPLKAIEVNWSYANSRAKADKSTFAIPGLEAFESGGARGKGSRTK